MWGRLWRLHIKQTYLRDGDHEIRGTSHAACRWTMWGRQWRPHINQNCLRDSDHKIRGTSHAACSWIMWGRQWRLHTKRTYLGDGDHEIRVIAVHHVVGQCQVGEGLCVRVQAKVLIIVTCEAVTWKGFGEDFWWLKAGWQFTFWALVLMYKMWKINQKTSSLSSVTVHFLTSVFLDIIILSIKSPPPPLSPFISLV